MKKVILKYKGKLPTDEIERLMMGIHRDLDEIGFVVIDDRFDVIEIDVGKESNGSTI